MTVRTVPSRSVIQDEPVAVRWRVPYGLWFPLLVYALARALDAALLLQAGRHQVAMIGLDPNYLLSFPTSAQPGYGSVASNWDGQWYERIVAQGYPSVLPLDARGQVQMNTWAFYPLFPLSAGLLARLTGLDFTTVAPALSALLGAAAVVVMYRLVRPAGRFAASATVVMTCAFMSAPALQLSYTEGAALLLICVSLLLLRSRHYVWFAVATLALSLTRPIALALAPVVVAHWLARRRDPADESFPRQRWAVALLVPWCIGAMGLWSFIAAVVTRDLFAYPKTMAAWKVYNSGSFQPARWVAREIRDRGLPLGLLLCLVLPALLVYVVRRPAARAWGTEVRTWAWAYPAYLFTATAPGPSIVRYLLLAFPLMWPCPDPLPPSLKARAPRLIVLGVAVVVGVLLQWYWISEYVVIHNQPHRGPFP